MEKLIELLNEREEKEKTSKIEWRIDNNPIGIYGYVGKYGLGFASKMIIISKEYGFIKWLVENDKIDRKKLEIRPFSDGLVYSDSDCTVYRSDTTYEMLLMLLSISDTPIEDLISYLK